MIGVFSLVQIASGDVRRPEGTVSDLGLESQAAIRPADTVAVALAVDVRFIDARSVSIDQSGRIYVVDAARNSVSVFDTDGELVGTFGGTGTNAGQFDEPADLDPTNGLILNVADTGNGRIQRFSKDLRFLESLPVPTSVDSNQDNSPSFRPGAERVQAPSGGRPIAVATSRADDLYVLEESSRSVIWWDRDRRSPRLIGKGPDQSEKLRQPVDLAVHADQLFIADDELNAVLVFDLFGVFQRRIDLKQQDRIVAIAILSDAIAAISRSSVRVISLDGNNSFTVVPRIPSGDTIVDAILSDEASGDITLHLLTPQRLYSVTFLPGSNN